MKAPDKIYLDPEIVANSEVTFIEAIVPEFRAEKNDIEYIRKDAFIEKALKWMTMKECIDGVLSVEMIDEFKTYMEKE